MGERKIKPGIYAHRFQGSALDPNETLNFLAGLGWMKVTKDGSGYLIEGNQESVDMPFRFMHLDDGDQPISDPKKRKYVRNRQFGLSGRLDWISNKRLWEAKIKFESVDSGNKQILSANFVVSSTANKDKYWIMSTGITHEAGDYIIPAEAVTGEVHFIDGT
jgi:hypothetical protein